MESKKLKQEVAKYPDFELTPNGKIHCKVSGHDLPARLEEFQKYLKSKSYKMALERNYDFSQHEPYIIPHKEDNNKLFCRVTGHTLNKLKSEVEKHVKGKKYNRLLPLYIENEKKKEEKAKRRAERLARIAAGQKPKDDESDFSVEEMDELYGEDAVDDEGIDEEDGQSWEEVDEEGEEGEENGEEVEGEEEEEEEDDDDDDDRIKVTKIVPNSKKISKTKGNKNGKSKNGKPTKGKPEKVKETVKNGGEQKKKANKKK